MSRRTSRARGPDRGVECGLIHARVIRMSVWSVDVSQWSAARDTTRVPEFT
jgi:hypothetical protein